MPALVGPTRPFIEAMERSIPLVKAAGWDEAMACEIGNPYISAARATMLRKALDARADVIVFLDYDLSWAPRDLLTLIETKGDVVAGLYRFKKDDEEYMGALETHPDGRPIVRADGCIKASRVPAGFLKITTQAVDRFMRGYPDLTYGPKYNPSTDLFNHGAFEGVWWGEDYAFSRRWLALGEDIWVVPDLDLTHHSSDQAYPGNYHQFLRGCPGGDLAKAA